MKFNPKENYVLEDERALLRPLEMEDFRNLKVFSEQEPELWTYSLVRADGEENLKSYMNYAFQQREEGTCYPFIVWDKKSGNYAGSTRFYDIRPEHRSLQLGYTWYGKAFQGTGLNKHCKYLLLNFAFETLDIERVEFRADARNERSIAAMKSIGCTTEGILRSNCASPDGRRDSIVLSILKEEWRSSVKQDLQTKL
jgi:RimJ/RimL family protein N-acetyltransferase